MMQPISMNRYVHVECRKHFANNHDKKPNAKSDKLSIYYTYSL